MNKTRIDIPENNRQHLVSLLNARLADTLDLALAAKQAHWSVKGPGFFFLHELFDKLAGDVREYADDLAERAEQLGGQAEGTLQQAARSTMLEPYPAELRDGLGHVEALAQRVSALGQRVRIAIDRAGELADADTADLLTGISRGLDKYLWMLEAHLSSEKTGEPKA